MTKETLTYTLKIYDKSLIDFDVRYDAFGSLVVTIKDIDQSNAHLLPMCLIMEQNEKGLSRWLRSRTIPKNRAFVEEILRTAGLTSNDILGILDVSKGLSVNDAYWVDNGKAAVSFDDINLYDNEFDEVLGLVAYTGYTPSQKHKAGLSSEWTLGGTFPKAVRRINGELYLFKTGMSGARNLGKEPYSEYFAAQVAERMGLEHVPYDLQMWKGELASVCKIMNGKDVSLVPFLTAGGDSRFPAALSILNEADELMAEKYRSMVVFDALICNRDRHGGNFSILRDNKTGRALGMAPLYDHNLSLFAQDDEADYDHLLDRSNLHYLPATANIPFNDMAGIVMGAKQHEQLRKMIDFKFENHPSLPVPQDRLDAFNSYIKQKTRELLEIPVIDEQQLEEAMESKLEEVRSETKVPLLAESVKPVIGSRQKHHEQEPVSLGDMVAELREGSEAAARMREVPARNAGPREER